MQSVLIYLKPSYLMKGGLAFLLEEGGDKKMRNLITLLSILGICFMFLSQTYAAATLTVCASGCDYTTIQETIDAANTGDTISILAPIHFEDGVMINKDLTIRGQGFENTTVKPPANAPPFSPAIFNVNESVAVTIRDMTITGVRLCLEGCGINSQGISRILNVLISKNEASGGGGIANFGDMTMDNSFVSNNEACTTGGGIFNEGVMVIRDSTVSGNGPSCGDVYGAGILNRGEMKIINSIVSSNKGEYGGGVRNLGDLTVEYSIISNNEANGYYAHDAGGGGGINNSGTLTLTATTVKNNIGGGLFNSGEMTITRCTVSSNNSSDGGGGIASSGKATLINTTISGNHARDFGGGIYNLASLTLINSTVSDNSSDELGGGIYMESYNSNTTTILSNSIVDGNNSGNCFLWDGLIISTGYNIDSDGTCIDTPTTGDQIGADPMFGPLQDNGGPTETHALLPGSPAIDAIPEEACIDPDGNAITADQRGVSRPQGIDCDIGAYEYVLSTICEYTNPADRAPASGSGTQADPYVIENCCELQGIADSNSKYYALGNNINCSDTVNWNNGRGFIPLGGNGGLIYSGGGLDGQGHVISNLFINDTLYTGLYARTSNVELTDFGLENVSISGSYLVGGVASNAYNGTSISDVYVGGSVSGSSIYVGGIVGSAGTGTSIANSYFQGQVSGTAVLGGLVGVATNTNGIDNCYADATVTGKSHSVGGLVGNFGGTISRAAIVDSYAAGMVETGSYKFRVGGLVGYLSAGGSVVNSFWDNNKDKCIGQDLGESSDCTYGIPD